MPILGSEQLSVYNSLADDMDAGLERLDEVAADMIREIMPEWHDAVSAINAALVEIDQLLFDGLRDEALTLHAPSLFDVALRFSLKSRPNSAEISEWFVFNELAEPPEIDGDALTNIEAAYTEIQRLAKGLARLRKMALTKEATTKKLALLRQLRKHDSAKIVWANQITMHEDALQRSVRESAKRAMTTGDFATVADCHAALVDPEWSGEVAKDLVKMTQGAEVAIEIQKHAASFSTTCEQLVELQKSHKDPTADVGLKVAEMLLELNQNKESISESAALLAEFPDMAQAVKKLGLLYALDAASGEVAEAIEWGAECASLHQTTQLFQQECMRIERLCEQLPSKKDESAWLADVERCDTEIKRCCQVIPSLIYPDFLRTQLHNARHSVRRRTDRRKTLALVAGGGVTLLFCVMIAAAGYYYLSQSARNAGVADLQRTVQESRLGMYDERPRAIQEAAEKGSQDAEVAELVAEFDANVERERDRRESFRELVAAARELSVAAASEVEDREQASTPEEKLDAWPPSLAKMGSDWIKARATGGYPKNRPEFAQTDEAATVTAKGPHFESEEEDLAELLKEYRALDQRLEKLANASFLELQTQLQARIEESESSSDGSDSKKILGDIAALKTKASSPKYSGDMPEGSTVSRVSEELVSGLDVLEAKLKQGLDD